MCDSSKSYRHFAAGWEQVELLLTGSDQDGFEYNTRYSKEGWAAILCGQSL